MNVSSNGYLNETIGITPKAIIINNTTLYVGISIAREAKKIKKEFNYQNKNKSTELG